MSRSITDTLSLPPLQLSSEDSSPTPDSPIRGSRNVSWNIPFSNVNSRPSGALPIIRIEGVHDENKSEDNCPKNNPYSSESLDWKRLHLSKAKLSIITEVAAVMAGFSVVATVELQINDDAEPILLTAFTVTTSLLVCTTMLAIMISTCILPHIEVTAQIKHSKASESPHDLLMWYIDLSWVLSNTVSIFLFTLDVIILCWIKFTYFSGKLHFIKTRVTASWCATVILSFVLVGVTFFGLVFFRKIVKHQYVISDQKYQQLEELKRQLDESARIINI